jgi:hypothetical protein
MFQSIEIPGIPEPPSEIVSEPVGDRPALPYAPFPMPRYKAIDGVEWQLWTTFFGAGPGYFLGHRGIPYKFYGLSRGNAPWMSLFPMEIESQWPHLEAASGHTVIGGLGMALMTYAVAMKPEVTKVTVVELDPEVVDLAPKFADMDAWPCRDKITIVNENLLTCVLQDSVDFLYVDIWRGYRQDPKIADMQAIHANIPAPRVGYWGQELEAVDWAVENGTPVQDFTAETFRAFCDEIGLPLIGLEEPTYPTLCQWAATNQAIGGAQPDPAWGETRSS